ncbi:MAG TPA: DUF456 domain-containing protein [Candidatus Binatia bacterium]|nr:DUF456 domain-containing protein [Candidatus Binatia bacterium]
MDLILQSVIFGLAVVFLLVGLIGVVIPLLPGSLLLWLTVAVYAAVERLNGFAAIDVATFAVITLIALVTGLSDLWLPLLGARVTGSSTRSLLFGVVGAIIGTFVLPLLGSVIGYVVGILVGEYRRYGDWNKALRAGLGGVAGWGIATAIQLGGGLLILIIFVWQVLAYQTLPGF